MMYETVSYVHCIYLSSFRRVLMVNCYYFHSTAEETKTQT